MEAIKFTVEALSDLNYRKKSGNSTALKKIRFTKVFKTS
jgi:hypothetical protein